MRRTGNPEALLIVIDDVANRILPDPDWIDPAALKLPPTVTALLELLTLRFEVVVISAKSAELPTIVPKEVDPVEFWKDILAFPPDEGPALKYVNPLVLSNPLVTSIVGVNTALPLAVVTLNVPENVFAPENV
jgi:hypothetical protein